MEFSFFLILKIKFGQISESTKKIMLGFHDDKNFLQENLHLKEKTMMNIFEIM